MLLLHSGAAGGCPLKTYNSFRPDLVRPAPAATAAPQWAPDHAGFTATVLAEVLAGTAAVVDLRGLRDQPGAEQEAACLAALADGADVIIGGRLPNDPDGHRAGRPDLLVRTEGGYLPGIIRAYRLFDSRGDDSVTRVSPLARLAEPVDLPRIRVRWRYRWHLALRLAHYHRMLTALGHAAPGACGLLVGDDPIEGLGQVAAWLDLTEAALPLAGGQPHPDGLDQTSALERYDFEFARRVDLARRAEAGDVGPSPDLVPIRHRECERCAWWPVCRDQLDDDDLSLRISKSPLDPHEIAMLREVGITTVTDLAAADLDALLPEYLPRVDHRHGSEERLRLAQRRSRLLQQGVQLQRTDAEPVRIPGAELEIDLDIETSAGERVYLWGFWVTDRVTGESGYEQFSDFRILDEEGELDLARRALSWLRERVEGADALVYHYSGYERDQLERLARRCHDPLLEWAVGYSRERFVDLFPIIRQHFFGTEGLGLKVVASLGAGFAWRDADPGGLNSMRWFDEAVGGEPAEQRERARTRVLEYNEDDVRATQRVRDWLRSLDAPG
ncbi:MAG: TM0106 family RecB-like putative nuclease [Propionicimonas sp.]